MGEVNLFNYQLNSFERICSIHELELAFRAVKRNRGAPGVDGVTIEMFEKNLLQELIQLKQDVESWRYQPSPVRKVEIPKPGSGGVRMLGVSTVRDSILNSVMKSV